MLKSTLFTLTPLALATNALLFEPPSAKRHAPIRRALAARAPAAGTNWVKLGCYTDTLTPRAMPALEITSDTMTNAYCQEYCDAHGYSLAGTEWSRECYCDNAIDSSLLATNSECDMTCTGAAEVCGGSARLTVWQNQGTVTDPDRQTVGDWTGQGCYSDSVANRALPTRIYIDGMTIQKCTTACFGGGYKYAGLEYGSECYCANTIITSDNVGAAVTDGCTMPCTGNPDQDCGGPDRLNVYTYSGTDGTLPTAPSQVPNVGDWTLKGCYTDDAGNRALPVREYVDGQMTVEKCTSKCLSLGYPYSGVEYANECYCSQAIGVTTTSGAPATDGGCDMPCEGLSTEICGGGDRLTVYEYTGTTTIPTVLDSYNGWTSKGCYVDSVNARVLTPVANAVAPMTVANCVDACDAAGYSIAGVEFASECYCGNALPPVAATEGCVMKCDGDDHLCGGPDRLNVYKKPPAYVQKPAQLYKGFSNDLCYKMDNINPPTASKKITMPSGKNSPQACMEACAFGPDGGEVWLYTGMCFCFNPGTAPWSTTTARCNQNCQGDYEYECGAYMNAPPPAYYYPYPSPFIVQTVTTLAPVLPPAKKLMGTGCTSAPLWTDYGKQYTLDNNSPDNCWAKCVNDGLPVMLLSQKFCYCSKNNDAFSGTVDASTCNQACAGDSTQKCGADTRTPERVGYFPHSVWTIDASVDA